MHTRFVVRSYQRGAVLVVSMLLLLVLTVLALTAGQATRMQERMAGNARDLDLAFQAGEAGLRDAETRIDTDIGPKGRNFNKCSNPATCDVEPRETAPLDFTNPPANFWNTSSHEMDEDLHEVNSRPRYVTELWGDIPDTLTIGGAQPPSGTLYMVNTSRAEGATPTASVILETTYAVRY